MAFAKKLRGKRRSNAFARPRQLRTLATYAKPVRIALTLTYLLTFYWGRGGMEHVVIERVTLKYACPIASIAYTGDLCATRQHGGFFCFNHRRPASRGRINTGQDVYLKKYITDFLVIF